MAHNMVFPTATTVEGGAIPLRTPEQVASVDRESEAFLAFLAIKNVNSVLQNPIAREQIERLVGVIDNYAENIQRTTEGYSPARRDALVQKVSALALEGVPLGYAELFHDRLRLRLQVADDSAKDQPPITTDQLEIMTAVTTDETVSPPRGVAIAKLRTALRQAGTRLIELTHS